MATRFVISRGLSRKFSHFLMVLVLLLTASPDAWGRPKRKRTPPNCPQNISQLAAPAPTKAEPESEPVAESSEQSQGHEDNETELPQNWMADMFGEEPSGSAVPAAPDAGVMDAGTTGFNFPTPRRARTGTLTKLFVTTQQGFARLRTDRLQRWRVISAATVSGAVIGIASLVYYNRPRPVEIERAEPAISAEQLEAGAPQAYDDSLAMERELAAMTGNLALIQDQLEIAKLMPQVVKVDLTAENAKEGPYAEVPTGEIWFENPAHKANPTLPEKIQLTYLELPRADLAPRAPGSVTELDFVIKADGTVASVSISTKSDSTAYDEALKECAMNWVFTAPGAIINLNKFKDRNTK